MSVDYSIKVVAVGDGAVGKTCLLFTYARGHYPGDRYEPTIFDESQADVIVQGQTVRLNLYDTAGQEDYQALRTLALPGSDVALVCFAVDSPSSYQNLATWVNEIRQYCPEANIILVGTKSDMRNADGGPIKQAQAEAIANQYKCWKYVECSARTSVDSVRNVMNEAILSYLNTRDGNKSDGKGCCCSIS